MGVSRFIIMFVRVGCIQQCSECAEIERGGVFVFERDGTGINKIGLGLEEASYCLLQSGNWDTMKGYGYGSEVFGSGSFEFGFTGGRNAGRPDRTCCKQNFKICLLAEIFTC